MARGRFISKGISTNKRLAGLEKGDAERLWVRCLANADRDGRVPRDAELILHELCPALAIEVGWTVPMVEDFVQELLASDLLEDHGDFLTVSRFHQHQVGLRYEKECSSRWNSDQGRTGSDQGRTGSDQGRQPGQPTPTKVANHGESGRPRSSEVKEEVKEEGQGQVEDSGPPSQPAPPGNGPLAGVVGRVVGSISSGDVSPHTPGSVLEIWRDFWEGRGLVPPLTGIDTEAVQKAVELGTFDRWPTREALEGEFRRTLAGMEKKGLDLTLRWLVNHLGESWAEKRRGGEGDAPVFDAEAYRKEIGA